MQTNEALFSVIIPLYNKEKNITQTIASVLSQSYKDFELVIVDDGSTDNSAGIVQSINDPRIKLFRKENGGVSSARNYGIEKASGEWILFLDADDFLQSGCLEKLYKIIFLAKEEHFDVIVGNYVNIKGGTEFALFGSRKYRGILDERNKYRWLFFNKMTMCPGCVLINKKQLVDTLFNESFSRYEDLDFMLRILKKSVVYIIPDIMFKYNRSSNSLSRPASNINGDFIFSMDFTKKSFWEKCILGEALYLATYTYPTRINELKRIYKKYYMYSYISNILKKLLKVSYVFHI